MTVKLVNYAKLRERYGFCEECGKEKICPDGHEN